MKAIILAAGYGKRMKSDLPKVLHTIIDKPMLHYVIEACIGAGVRDIAVVIGQGGEEVQKATPYDVRFVKQDKQLGTGHAVICAKEHIEPDDNVLILHGDAPLVTADVLRGLIDFQEKNDAHAALISTTVPDPHGYGRLLASESGDFEAIVEQKDLPPHQLDIKEINPAVYVFKGRALLHGLELLDNNNSQQEYYMTDVPKNIQENGFRVMVCNDPCYQTYLGVNSQKQLAEAAAVMRARIADKHFENGVVIIDPASVYISADAEIEAGAVLQPGTMLNGRCKIGKGAVIGPNTQLTNSTVGAGSVVRNSVAEDSKIGEECTIGPFAYLRGGADIGNGCRVGDFVEIKGSVLGEKSAAAHLAYIGDATVGSGVNFGCGAITVNYDGRAKHKTEIGDYAFIGCNANLIAPVKVGGGAFVAAGSTITDDVPADAMAIARERQTTKEGRAKGYYSKKK